MSAKSARTLRSENEFIGSCVIIVNRFLLGSVCGKERLKAAVEIEAVTVLSTELVIELLQELTVAFQRDARSVVVLTCFDHNGLSSSVGLNFIWHIAIVPFARQRELEEWAELRDRFPPQKMSRPLGRVGTPQHKLWKFLNAPWQPLHSQGGGRWACAKGIIRGPWNLKEWRWTRSFNKCNTAPSNWHERQATGIYASCCRQIPVTPITKMLLSIMSGKLNHFVRDQQSVFMHFGQTQMFLSNHRMDEDECWYILVGRC